MNYFDNVIGHEAIKTHLADLLNKGTLPHSLLFFGEAGLGKLNMAIALASHILGRQVFSVDAGLSYLSEVHTARKEDGESEKKIDTEGLPIYADKGEAFWLRPMKTGLKVEQWYSLLQGFLIHKVERPRVIIVEGFHTANSIMANAMLKTIEEPPENVFFIIITNKRATVLPTIVSRCMAVPFSAVEDVVLRKALLTQGYLADTNFEKALAAGHGNLGIVKQLLEEGEMPLLELAMELLEDIIVKRNFFTITSLRGEKLSREELAEVLVWMRTLSRDMMALRFGAENAILQCPTYKERLVQILPRWSSRALTNVCSETLQGEAALRLFVKANLVLDGIVIALRRITKEDIP